MLLFVLPNPIRGSFHPTANDVFKDSIKVKMSLVLKLSPIYVDPS